MVEIATTVTVTTAGISGLTDMLTGFLQEQGVDARSTHHVVLIVEEILTNVGEHGGGAGTPARVTLAVDPGQVRGEVADRGTAFDPRGAPEPDLDAPGDERPIGGLGLFLVRKFSATLEYASQNGENVTRFAVTRA